MPRGVSIKFLFDRETKTKAVFIEDSAPGEDDVCGKIYVSKAVLETMGNPRGLLVSVEAQG